MLGIRKWRGGQGGRGYGDKGAESGVEGAESGVEGAGSGGRGGGDRLGGIGGGTLKRLDGKWIFFLANS